MKDLKSVFDFQMWICFHTENMTNVYTRVCRKTLFSSDQFETPGELSLGMDY